MSEPPEPRPGAAAQDRSSRGARVAVPGAEEQRRDDLAMVTALLGHAPRGDLAVVRRRRDRVPSVIENAPLLHDGTPMPTRFWLVDPELRAAVSRLESEGGVRAAEAAVDPAELARAHERYAAARDALIPAGRRGPRPTGGVGGARAGVKCLHAHLAWWLAGGDDPVGAWVAERLGTSRELPDQPEEVRSRRAGAATGSSGAQDPGSRRAPPSVRGGSHAADRLLERKDYRTLSVIVPVYNERATVAEIIRRVRAADVPLVVDVVVVDDGSTDGTDQVLAAVADSTVRVVRHERNRGKGAAVRTALERATGDLVIVQDADLEYDPDDWSQLLDPILKHKAHVVYGSRFTGGRKNMLLLHWIGNRFLSLVTNLLYATTLSDMETCYKAFDRRVIDGMTIESDRFEFEPEITAKVLRRGYRIYEVPISYAGREPEEGKKITWRDGFSALRALVKFRFTRL
jgi:hypothetical protein